MRAAPTRLNRMFFYKRFLHGMTMCMFHQIVFFFIFPRSSFKRICMTRVLEHLSGVNLIRVNNETIMLCLKRTFKKHRI